MRIAYRTASSTRERAGVCRSHDDDCSSGFRPLGLVTNPRGSRENERYRLWLENLLATGARVCVPEIADYEIRCELLRANKNEGINRINDLKSKADYLPITTEAMLQAAEFWARARRMGRQTADDKALDGDMILAAQATLCGGPDAVIATRNPGHLALFVQAYDWVDILPLSDRA